ncbi:MAG: 1-deoxy-D-xylulose-5-phosphate synthase [Deltaproteobacteria bacterium]|nr:1-deoxy-D-xylulose-5-phosphate synthase [Deltaproteobacteria bacterium]MBW2071714.1 1-deoxy-D-xylulose-5-phosphate synthase [Deltaproteobacteria bacterium]
MAKKEQEKASLLSRINSPADLKVLSLKELEQLAAEIRTEIICTVAQNGGHLAANLGTVELTLALHRVFDAPRDVIIWDVGHQAYTHKLITGRREQFHTLRQHGGISGFPRRTESPYDTFGTGHASTSISAALGFATGRHMKGEGGRVVAVIGDGSMTGGMAFEGLNQAGFLEKDLIVVLNDNEMSIAPNVGALSSFLSRKKTSKIAHHFKKEIESLLNSIPGIGSNILQLVKRGEDSFMSFFTPGMLFEALKFEYIGPIRGHRLSKLIEAFANVQHLEGPVLVHVLTTKGKGYQPAECNPAKFHGLGSFKVRTGAPRSETAAPSYTRIFGETLAKFAAEDERIVAITAAMPEGTGLSEFARLYPDRFFDVGICEQHAVTFAAGLALEGFKPVVAIYSTFLQRGFDQVIHDICLQNIAVVFAMDRAGLVGEDGPTHHGLFDLSYLRCIPRMVIMAPADENELQRMLKTALEYDGPIALRYPRGSAQGVPLQDPVTPVEIGKAKVIRQGKDLAILAIGNRVATAAEAAGVLAAEGIEAAVVNCRFVKPLDREVVLRMASDTGKLITVEENVLQGGFGSAVLETLADDGHPAVRVVRLGIGDQFVEHGSQAIQRKRSGIDSGAIIRAARALVRENDKGEAASG